MLNAATEAVRDALVELLTSEPHPGLGDSFTLTEIADARKDLRSCFGSTTEDENLTDLDRVHLLLRAVGGVAETASTPDAPDSPRDELLRLAALTLAWLARVPRCDEPPF
jgi:hypothetical protein